MNDNDIVIIHIYGDTMSMSRGRALEKFFEYIMCSEGAEKERYVNVYFGLMSGKTEVWD